MRRRLPHHLLGLLVAALLIAGCGRDNPHLIAQDRADKLSSTVDEVARRVSDHDCAGARQALTDARNQVIELPPGTSRGLRTNLRQWLNHLGERIQTDCTEAEATPTATATATATETATATATETPTETPTPTPTESATPSPSATPTPTSTAQPDGGTGAPEETG